MSAIIDFISGLTYDDIPEAALRSAKRCVLDAVGCMIGGMAHPPVRALAGTIARSQPGNSAIPTTGLTASRAWASFVNTHAASYFDLDDGHRKAQGHPGGVIVPLALMLAAENNCSGQELLTAVVAGYETAVRSALIMRRLGGPRKGSGAWSITGGAAAAARLNGLSRRHLQHALGLAEYYAPQAPQDRSLQGPSSMKEAMAWAAHTSVTTVELAGSGFDGMNPFLADAGECSDLGSRWEIESVYFKQYACCRFSHPVLDGLSGLITKHRIPLDAISAITVRSFDKALLLSKTRPDNPVAAMYSIPYAVGCRLVNGRVGPESMTASSLSDSRVLRMADKVTIEESPDLTARFPEKCLASVSILMNDGSRVQSPILSAKGDPDNPYSTEELIDKFLHLSQTLPGETQQGLIASILDIDHANPREIWNGLLS